MGQELIELAHKHDSSSEAFSMRDLEGYLAGRSNGIFSIASVDLSAETSHCRGDLLALAELRSWRFLHYSNALYAKDSWELDGRRMALTSEELGSIQSESLYTDEDLPGARLGEWQVFEPQNLSWSRLTKHCCLESGHGEAESAQPDCDGRQIPCCKANKPFHSSCFISSRLGYASL